jgi:hypothetical protein
MKTIIANYVRTTQGGANWYSVSTSKLTPELLEYFQGKAERSPQYCKVSEETVSWCTQFEWADQLAISTVISKSSGQLCLRCEPVLTAEQRRTAAEGLRKQFPADATTTTSVDVEPEF